jgi:hypothetical protein
MSILHIVLIKWKDGVSQAQIDEQLKITDTLTGIPGVEWVHTGESFAGERSLGFTHISLLRLKDREHLDNFRSHPLHQAMLPGFGALLDQGLVFDCDERGGPMASRQGIPGLSG